VTGVEAAGEPALGSASGFSATASASAILLAFALAASATLIVWTSEFSVSGPGLAGSGWATTSDDAAGAGLVDSGADVAAAFSAFASTAAATRLVLAFAASTTFTDSVSEITTPGSGFGG
jgi:hypothetical protein